MTISPWKDHVKLTSPDGKITAGIADAWEIAMGAPTSGELVLSNGIRRDNCNPSMVWSENSQYLAVPQWTKKRNQRLLIISISRRSARYASGEYRALQLESFTGNVIKGIDSPFHMPKKIEIDISKINWGDS